MKKAVCLDGFTTNPGDLSWEPILSICDMTVYDRTDKDNAEEIISRAYDAEIVILNKVPITREIIDRLPNMKFIALLSTGYDAVDIQYAREKGIPVANVPAYSTDTVAQHTFALILSLTNDTLNLCNSVKSGGWTKSSDFTYMINPMEELTGRNLGLLGYGMIGKRVGEIGRAFGMNIYANTRTRRDLDGAVYKDLDELLDISHVVSLHLPLLDDNIKIVNKEFLAKMQKESYFINTSRGGLVDEDALAEALNKGLIKGAGLDVLGSEPPNEDNPLLYSANTIITPHRAWSSKSARGRLIKIISENINGYLTGNLQNIVN